MARRSVSHKIYSTSMIEIRQTTMFAKWLDGLKDHKARVKIAVRIDRLALGNPGDVKTIGSGVSEMRIDYGPGYRVYFIQRGEALILLLCGGDKKSQQRDIAAAQALDAAWECE